MEGHDEGNSQHDPLHNPLLHSPALVLNPECAQISKAMEQRRRVGDEVNGMAIAPLTPYWLWSHH